jgi:hypothetical protein
VRLFLGFASSFRHFNMISWVMSEPKSSSRLIFVRSLASSIAVTFASQCFGKDLRIFLTFSTLVAIAKSF